MLVEEAAKRLQMNPQTLRLALQQVYFHLEWQSRPPKIDIHIRFSLSVWKSIWKGSDYNDSASRD